MDGFAARYKDLVFWILCGVIVLLAFFLVLPFVAALIWATVLSVLTYPLYQRFRKRMSPNWAAISTTLLTLLIIGIPLVAVGFAIFFQANTAIQEYASSRPVTESGTNLEGLLKEADRVLHPLIIKIGGGDFSIEEYVGENRSSLTKSLAAPAAKAAVQAGRAALTLVIAFLTMFFMIRDGHTLKKPVLELLPLPEEQSQGILDRLAETIRAVFVGVVFVAFLQGTCAGIAYWALGVPSPLLWTVATMVICTIPLLGAPIIYVPLGLMLIAKGQVWQGVTLIVIGFAIVSNIDNVIRPFVIGARVSLHPMAVFFGLLGGVFLFGPIGIMAGPLILMLVLAVQDVIRLRLNQTELKPQES